MGERKAVDETGHCLQRELLGTFWKTWWRPQQPFLPHCLRPNRWANPAGCVALWLCVWDAPPTRPHSPLLIFLLPAPPAPPPRLSWKRDSGGPAGSSSLVTRLASPIPGGLSLQPSLALAGGDSFVEGAIPGPPPPPGLRPFLGSPPPSCREEVPRVVSVGAPRLVWLKCAHLMWCQCLFGCGEQRGWSASSLGLVASRRILSGSVKPGTHLPPLLIV